MTTAITKPTKRSLEAADVALLMLTVVSGPLLVWLGLQGKSTQSALGQVEMLIAAGCVVIGILICLITLTMSLGAVLMLVGHRVQSRRWMRWGWAISPWFLRRLAVGVLGVHLVSSGAAFAAESSWEAPSPAWSQHTTSALTHTDPTDVAPAAASDGAWMPVAPEAVVTSPDHRTTHLEHIVVTGDSLWGIAAAELGPSATAYEIDQRWRQWWQENRHSIGDNPHVLIPGTVLTTPAWTH